LRRLYGSNVCGEGGEYETLTLDCPLFAHGRIVLDSWQAVMLSEDSMAPVALLHPTAFHVENKQPAGEGVSSRSGDGDIAAEGQAAAGCVIEVPSDWTPAAAPQLTARAATENAAAEEQADAALDVQLSMADGSQYCSLTASVAPAGAGALDLASAAGTAAALSAALRRLSAALPALGLSWQCSVFVHLYVPSMAQFAAANAAYAAFLPAVNPPSRATVQLSSVAGLALVVEVLLAR
jgi:diphthine-ammonia ligase